jgi:hypothetical protein
MRKRLIVTALAVCSIFGTAGIAQAGNGSEIREACGASFGQLVSAARSSGTSAHGNYSGGANAFANPAILAAHGCAV